MKVGIMVYYITGGKLHIGQVLYKKDNIVNIRENRKIARKKVSEVAWEVSSECRRIGLENMGGQRTQKNSVSAFGNGGHSASVD